MVGSAQVERTGGRVGKEVGEYLVAAGRHVGCRDRYFSIGIHDIVVRPPVCPYWSDGYRDAMKRPEPLSECRT